MGYLNTNNRLSTCPFLLFYHSIRAPFLTGFLVLEPQLLLGFWGMTSDQERREMDPAEMIIPVLSIAAAAAITFYAVSFNELKEKSWEELEKKHPESEILDTESSVNAKERKSKKQATKAEKNF